MLARTHVHTVIVPGFVCVRFSYRFVHVFFFFSKSIEIISLPQNEHSHMLISVREKRGGGRKRATGVHTRQLASSYNGFNGRLSPCRVERGLYAETHLARLRTAGTGAGRNTFRDVCLFVGLELSRVGTVYVREDG